jgi:hypothetical protein
MALQLITDAGAVTTGSTFPVEANLVPRVIQVSSTGTATVVLEGRAVPTAPWITVATYTASAAESVTCLPEMRARVSVWTSGVVNVWLA